ncbi:hypothetical protein H9P43_007277 [Blastocladiella emersonii ATCC 22665]|nr:hypothetical protein H9P43_007277 [Blastocladiella emersonii ATCC 22665]
MNRSVARRLLAATLALAWAGLAAGAVQQQAAITTALFAERQTLADLDVIAFGDANGDKFADVFALDEHRHILSLLVWNPKSKKFELPTPRVAIDVSSSPGHYIATAVPGDFDGTGSLDLLLTLANATSGTLSYDVELATGANGTFTRAAQPLIMGMRDAEPTLADVSGQLMLDILGIAPGNGNETAGLARWPNVALTTPVTPFAATPVPMNASMCVPAAGHSNAFVDLDGDCSPDLFLTCADGSFQVWTTTAAREVAPILENGRAAEFATAWRLVRKGTVPAGAGPIAFADMDADGTLDAVFTVCAGAAPCAVHVVYNRQIPLCASSSADTGGWNECRTLDALCSADPAFRLDFAAAHVIPLPAGSNAAAARGASDLSRLRVGDLNLDGYPDLLFVSGGALEILENVPCVRGLAGGNCAAAATLSSDPRAFVPVAHGIPPHRDLFDAAWFDLDENGSLDVMLRLADGKSTPRTVFYENKLTNDAFFIKTVTTGAAAAGAAAGCAGRGECQVHGVNALGSSFKLTVTDPQGRTKAIQMTQPYQSAHQTLHLPYAFSGLGRTNNYIETLAVGVSRNVSARTSFAGIIPNSQLVVYPPRAGSGTTNSAAAMIAGGTGWRIELFINPGQYALAVLTVLIVALVALGVITGLLHWAERREDEREKIAWI